MSKVLGFLTVDNKGRTTIPREMRQELGLDKGAQLRVDRTKNGVFELVPSALVPLDQLWFHTPEIQARIRKGEDDLASGRSHRTSGPRETKRYLDSLKSKRGAKASRKK